MIEPMDVSAEKIDEVLRFYGCNWAPPKNNRSRKKPTASEREILLRLTDDQTIELVSHALIYARWIRGLGANGSKALLNLIHRGWVRMMRVENEDRVRFHHLPSNRIGWTEPYVYRLELTEKGRVHI